MNQSRRAAEMSIFGPEWSASRRGSIASVQANLPVHLIATAREEFQTCLLDDPIGAVVEGNRVARFDYLPVVSPDETHAAPIVGLLHIVPFMTGAVPDRCVADVCDRLSDRNLIGADASLLDFVRSADTQGCRLIVSGPEIRGLVSLSDLQQLPVRAALFALITHLEMTMTEAIGRLYSGPDEWMGCLSPGRVEKLRGEIEKSTGGDGFIEALLMTQFCDKRDLIAKKLPSSEAADFIRAMKRIEILRNALAHANEYAATRKTALEVCCVVRTADSLAGRLDQLG